MRRRAAVIAYDIPCNRRRRKLHYRLQQWRLDGQYSLFECELTDSEAEELFLQLQECMNEAEDRLFLAWLDKRRSPRQLTQPACLGFRRPVMYMG